jgi:DNA-binding MarR family transcriptional regulator
MSTDLRRRRQAPPTSNLGSTFAGRHPLIRLLDVGLGAFEEELTKRVADTPYSDIRITHGCVFGNIDPEGTRLTELAERAFMTKQSVGEVVSDLEQRGYAERVPDPSDGRAKIIRLTERGQAARALGMQLIDELEQEWGERFGADRVAALRDALEAITAERLGAVPVA